MSQNPPSSQSASLVRTNAAFARAVHAASAQRNWSRCTLAAEAGVPLSAIQAIYRRLPLAPDAISAVCRCLDLPPPRVFDRAPLQQLGRLLRDRRESAGLSRSALGRLARLSDSTIKFIENGLHAPRPATCQRLLGVTELALTWTDLQACADSAPESGTPCQESPVFRLDPSLSVEMVREQLLLTDELLRHQQGVESGPSGWRRACWLCGARSVTVASRLEDVHRLTLRHTLTCIGQLAESLLQRYPVIHDWAQLERRSRLTPTARHLHPEGQHATGERVYGCRGGAELGEQLAYASAVPASLYRNGVVAGLLWALGLGPCPLGVPMDAFGEEAARRLLVAASAAMDAAEPAGFLRGVVDTMNWLLAPYAAPPQAPSGAGESSLMASRSF